MASRCQKSVSSDRCPVGSANQNSAWRIGQLWDLSCQKLYQCLLRVQADTQYRLAQVADVRGQPPRLGTRKLLYQLSPPWAQGIRCVREPLFYPLALVLSQGNYLHKAFDNGA